MQTFLPYLIEGIFAIIISVLFWYGTDSIAVGIGSFFLMGHIIDLNRKITRLTQRQKDS